ncbi:hypothetical protein LXP63_21195, partial [Yersinia pestis subsp. pestis]
GTKKALAASKVLFLKVVDPKPSASSSDLLIIVLNLLVIVLNLLVIISDLLVTVCFDGDRQLNIDQRGNKLPRCKNMWMPLSIVSSLMKPKQSSEG